MPQNVHTCFCRKTIKTLVNIDEHCVKIRCQKKFFGLARFVFVSVCVCLFASVHACVVVCIGVRIFNVCAMCVRESV